MAAGLQDSGVEDAFSVSDIYAFVLSLSKEQAESVRGKARLLIAYVRYLPEEHAALLAQTVEHAAEIRIQT